MSLTKSINGGLTGSRADTKPLQHKTKTQNNQPTYSATHARKLYQRRAYLRNIAKELESVDAEYKAVTAALAVSRYVETPAFKERQEVVRTPTVVHLIEALKSSNKNKKSLATQSRAAYDDLCKPTPLAPTKEHKLLNRDRKQTERHLALIRDNQSDLTPDDHDWNYNAREIQISEDRLRQHNIYVARNTKPLITDDDVVILTYAKAAQKWADCSQERNKLAIPSQFSKFNKIKQPEKKKRINAAFKRRAILGYEQRRLEKLGRHQAETKSPTALLSSPSTKLVPDNDLKPWTRGRVRGGRNNKLYPVPLGKHQPSKQRRTKLPKRAENDYAKPSPGSKIH